MPVTPDKPHSPLTLIEIGALAAVAIIWGVNNAAAKVATEHLPPLLTGSMRFGITALCLAVFIRPPFPNLKSLAIITLVGGPLHYGLIYTAFWLAKDVSPVSVAAQLWIPFTALFAFLLLGERLSRPALIGMGIAFLGVAWMSADPHALEDWGAILVGVAASAAWALTTVIARRTTSIPPLKMQGLLAMVTLPGLGFASAMVEHDQWQSVAAAPPIAWAAVLFGGIASSVVATSLVFWLVQKREAGRVTPYLLATPVVSIVIGGLFLGDVLTIQILTGAALTIGGVAVVALAERGLRAGAAKG
ncbi:DMT family transporter [Brevundimonas vitis]|uniref:DMT family transporter n=1 Tax=Brevundimonas vitisensis TaxID=2800818 RepID=A0ABX7BRS9_9CAUL|nr:DMT family transporter [Brevundimonas vitisensis]QQQ19428.1 DMT family transporter [Brevundimonas vitisensis]